MKTNSTQHLGSRFVGAAICLAAASLSGCGGGSSGSPIEPGALSAPTVGAAPANTQAVLSWPAVAGATSYNVYTSPTSPVTTASSRTTVNTAGTTLSGLSNGTPVFAAVSAVNAAGESPLSSEVCAVPTAASTAGVALYDRLCGSALDGTKWETPLFTRNVVNGALSVSAQASNMERFDGRGIAYATVVPVNDGGQRVTTVQASVTVPAASAARTGAAEISAGIRLIYQPPAGRLFPVDNTDLIVVHAGLRDAGGGLRAFRDVWHCDNATCTVQGASGIGFADPAGFSGETAASYDATYVVTVALDEATGTFAWAIAGNGLNVSGTADPSAYLASNASWAAAGPSPLSNGSYVASGPRLTILDRSGGSSGRIGASFDDVMVGFNGAAAAPWDDFSAAGGNSGPAELSAAKWSLVPGASSMALAGGSLVGHAQATTPSAATLQVFHPLTFADPTTINTVQADFAPTSCGNSLFGTLRIGMGGAIYNDGSPGTSAPNINQPNSRVGDITASLFLDCKLDEVRYQVTRFDTNSAQTILGAGAVAKGAASVIGNTHTLRMKWDPAAHRLTFQADGQTPLVVDPTTVNANMSIAAPYVKAPNVPNKSLSWFLFFPASTSAGAAANVDFKANNVFTAP